MIRPIHAFLGLFGECEEIAKVIGNYILNGVKPDNLNCEEEAGDFLWYLNQWLSCFGSNIPLAAKRNIAKLRKRYPNKFTEQAAQNRDVAAERAAMESQ
jgi:NTP pyrophosphatase (non-canonical NTP hydrolase)